jgi:thiol-disulfide isomerase/thioredoxin
MERQGAMRALEAVLIGLALFVLTTSAAAVGVGRKAPEFLGGGPWFNTDGKPLTVAGLRGKVVVVEMWTAGCYNCVNTLPFVKQWDARYRQKGLVIVGVHTPEFSHERSEQYVQASIAKLGIRYPVVMDNGYKIWQAYNNVYWPTIYIIDKKGIVRYTHVGEGAYDESENTIRKLLAEEA